jgi:hypothetical protein
VGEALRRAFPEGQVITEKLKHRDHRDHRESESRVD